MDSAQNLMGLRVKNVAKFLDIFHFLLFFLLRSICIAGGMNAAPTVNLMALPL